VVDRRLKATTILTVLIAATANPVHAQRHHPLSADLRQRRPRPAPPSRQPSLRRHPREARPLRQL